MIYSRPTDLAPVDQGDIIDGCPTAVAESLALDNGSPVGFRTTLSRVYVLTQTCDLAQDKTSRLVVARVLDASALVTSGMLKAAEVRGNIRAGRVHGWYFLPKSRSLNITESIVDLRTLHTVSRDVLEELCRQGKRIAHLESLYREHLAQHFANTYCRIGLPMPYETD